MRILIVFMILPFICFCASKDQKFKVSTVEMGNTNKYHMVKDSYTHDLSGAATNADHMITVDDGGKAPKYKFLRSMNKNLSENRAFKLTRTHKDLESATYQNGYFIVATSFREKSEDFNLVTRFKWDGKSLTDEKTINLKNFLLPALKKKFPSNWYNIVSISKSRKGGLNIEGLTASGQANNTLVFGLRSPLFGNVEKDPNVIQKNGNAILAYVTNTFSSSPSISFKNIDLKGHGVRGMEYIPHLKGYVIIGGPTFKANDYSLWLLPLNSNQALPLYVQGFKELCRPEAVIPSDNHSIIILSEASGEACKNSTNSYLKAKVVTD